ncbi:uncharacterized protein KY384_006531 [Bacidia gigantensis]|uniref:uncharacterized protein n=1 Tax=Bacidia gigantensis TaxID=2732470 RepID=UPI001D049716|nr:uncharacterized protein KY384_006531 [Bacidia gigantensis]KAG8528842.1 hypothetical protein KY384_006531 [Bacidia gigantensis]
MAWYTHPTSFKDVSIVSNGWGSQSSYNAPLQATLARAQLASTTGQSPPPLHSSHPSIPHLTLLVFEAVLEVVCVSFPGYIVARQGMFTAEMQKFTANLNVALFTPCLIFTKLASQLTADKLVELAIIPIIFVVQIAVSYACAFGLSKLFGFAKRPRNFVIAMGVFGNSNSLPISLVLSLSRTIKGLHWSRVPGDNDDEVAARGILYLLVFQQLGQLVRWTWGYNVLLAPPDKVQGTIENTNAHLENGEASSEEEREHLIRNSPDTDRDEIFGSSSGDTRVGTRTASLDSLKDHKTHASFSGQETPVTYQRRSSPTHSTSSMRSAFNPKTQPQLLPTPANGNTMPQVAGSEISTVNQLQSVTEFRKGIRGLPNRCRAALSRSLMQCSGCARRVSTSTFEALPQAFQTALRIFYRAAKKTALGVWEFMNPPLWAMLAAIVVASIPELQYFFFAKGTFFKNSVTSAINQSGGVAVPLILVVLGGNLARNTLPNKHHTREDDKEETKLLIASILSRMVLPTLIMAPLLAVTAKFVPVSILDDPIFIIVCFLIIGAPSALQLAQICQINNVYMGAMSRLLFQSYVIWILPSTLILVMCALEVVEWAQR